MNWNLLFAATNAVALAGWLALAALPRREPVLTAVLWAGIALLSAVYTVLFVGLVSGMFDPGRDPVGPAYAFEYSVEGLRNAFAARGVVVLGWTHYLAFDLFVGLWIARDADGRKVGRLTQIPFLFATFMVGPVGLLAWLLSRRWLGSVRRR